MTHYVICPVPFGVKSLFTDGAEVGFSVQMNSHVNIKISFLRKVFLADGTIELFEVEMCILIMFE